MREPIPSAAFRSSSKSHEQSAATRTEVGPLQASTLGPLQMSTPTVSVAATASASTEHRDSRTGTVAGHVLFAYHDSSARVKVFSATGRLVGRHDVRWRHNSFRFVLKPGRYEVVVKLRSSHGGSTCGLNHQRVRVRQNRATRVSFSEGCNY